MSCRTSRNRVLSVIVSTLANVFCRLVACAFDVRDGISRKFLRQRHKLFGLVGWGAIFLRLNLVDFAQIRGDSIVIVLKGLFS